MSAKDITSLAKIVLVLGIVGVHIALPIIGVVTIPAGLLAGLWLFWMR